jgi:hypothetical protein
MPLTYLRKGSAPGTAIAFRGRNRTLRVPVLPQSRISGALTRRYCSSVSSEVHSEVHSEVNSWVNSESVGGRRRCLNRSARGSDQQKDVAPAPRTP